MKSKSIRPVKVQHSLPFFALCAGLLLGLPSAGLALAGADNNDRVAPLAALGFDVFTPASVDPALAARVADKARARGIRFTPASATPITGAERTVTVAVRVDDETAQAISVRKAIDTAPGNGVGIVGLDTSRFQLGKARGYKSFARPVDLTSRISSMGLPDLAEFEPSRPKADDKPNRLQTRIAVEDREVVGRSPNTLDSASTQIVDVGGSFSLSPNLNVTAGVRYSNQHERLDPLTNSVQDSQAVYVGTQIKF